MMYTGWREAQEGVKEKEKKKKKDKKKEQQGGGGGKEEEEREVFAEGVNEYLPFHEAFAKLAEIEKVVGERYAKGEEGREVDDEVHLVHLNEMKRLWVELGGVLQEKIGEVERSISFEKGLEGGE